MASSTPRTPEQFRSGRTHSDDFHVNELASDKAGSMSPFGPELEGKPFHLVYPESRRDDPTVRAVREWVMAVPGGLCEVMT